MIEHKLEHYRDYVDGRFTEAAASMLDVYNPATQELLARVPESSSDTVEAAIAAARKAQPSWEKTPAIQRAAYLRQISAKLRQNVDRLAQIISREQGKILALATVEVNFTADYIDYMAEWARRLDGEVLTSDRQGEHIWLMRKPIGVVAGILPWNFPFFLIARKMAPALITGNTIVMKPSEETPINAYEFAKLVAETDLPAGVFNLVCGRGVSVGSQLSSHTGIDLITFTGSIPTGIRIMQAAAQNLTRVNLELGGKAPAIVLNDADLELTAKALVDSRIINTGQVCNCVERVYVQRGIADALTEKLAAKFAATRFGDPIAQPDVEMGPLVNRVGRDKVAAMVERARSEGAQVVTGGRIVESKGWHYEPTLITNCTADMEIMRKEIFGPVLPIQIIDDLDEAVALANDSEYGLTSSIFTRDINSAMRAVRDLKFGETYINREHFEAMQGFHAGRRKSGIGGADGKHGLLEFTETHVVYLQTQ